MSPYIICHMLSSVDGKIDGNALRAVMRDGEYETTGALLGGDAWLCGRTTMQQHFADPNPFISASKRAAGPRPVHVACQAESYAISVDTLGKLRWSGSEIGGDHLICILSELVPEDYLQMLQHQGISFIVAGRPGVDLVEAVRLLGEYFGIRTLLLEGGGHINGAFLEAGLVNEVSLLIVPGIDGRHEIPSSFDCASTGRKAAIPLKLRSVEQRANDGLWIRYDVVPSSSGELKN